VPAIANLEAICQEHLKGFYRLEVVDVLEHPRLAMAEGALVTPSLANSRWEWKFHRLAPWCSQPGPRCGWKQRISCGHCGNACHCSAHSIAIRM
jgi:hypothetical protein